MSTYLLTLYHGSDLSDDDYTYHVWSAVLTHAATGDEVFPSAEPYDDEQYMTTYDEAHPDIAISLTAGQLSGLEPVHLNHLGGEVASAFDAALDRYRKYAAYTGFTFEP